MSHTAAQENTESGPTFTDRIDRHAWSDLGWDRYVKGYIKPLKPVVVSGALDHWPARNKWTLDFFAERYGDLPLTIDKRDLSMAQLIAEVKASTPEAPAPYLRNHLVTKLPEALQADIAPMPDCTRPNWLEHSLVRSHGSFTFTELYVGGAGARFPVLHYDGLHTHAFLMQLYGVKEYVVFAPDQTEFMYVRDLTPSQSNLSAVSNVEKGDPEKFPLFSRATGARFKLNPGETLFVPAGWWHTARILTPSITVSINGANAANWADFRDDFCTYHMADRKLKAIAARAYLTMVGVYLSASELLARPFLGS